MKKACDICGKDISMWDKIFSSEQRLCQSCKNEVKIKVSKYIEKIRKYGEDSFITEEEENELNKLKSELNLGDAELNEAKKILNVYREMTNNKKLHIFDKALEEAFKDKYISKEEEEYLETLIQKEKIDLKGEDSILHKLFKYKRLSLFKDSVFPILPVEIKLKKNEKCFYEVWASLIEEKIQTTYRGSSFGVSYRIGKRTSISSRTYTGHRLENIVNKISDNGSLYLTNERVIFVGDRKNVTYKMKDIILIKKFADGIKFQTENESKPKIFYIKNQDVYTEYDSNYLKMPYDAQDIISEIELIVSKCVENIEA